MSASVPTKQACLVMLLVSILGCGHREGSPLRLAPGLQIEVEGRSISNSSPKLLRPGDSLQLTVRLQNPHESRDVTRDAGTKYTSLAPWALEVSASGKVKVLPDALKLSAPGTSVAAPILVQHQLGAKLALATALFEIADETAESSGLEIKMPTTRLGIGQTVVLSVQGEKGDLVAKGAPLKYYTTDESMLIPEGDGRVTAIGTGGRPRESAIIGINFGKQHRSISFDLVTDGPGPSLSVIPESVRVPEGESTRVTVRDPKHGDIDLSSTSTGTRYLTFPGWGRNDPRYLAIDESGTARATDSIGRLRSCSVIVFVRNGKSVGWTTIEVVHRPNESAEHRLQGPPC